MAQAGGLFPHLPLPVLIHGPADLGGGGKSHPDTVRAKSNPKGHVAKLRTELQRERGEWDRRKVERHEDAPPLPAGMPLLLKVEPDVDLDWLITGFELEVVSEEDDGYVLVASSEEELSKFLQQLQDFQGGIHGSGGVARIHAIGSSQDRLRQILKDGSLYERWGSIRDEELYTVDVGIECRGTERYPGRPQRNTEETVEEFKERLRKYAAEKPHKSLEKYRQRYPRKPAEAEAAFALRIQSWKAKVQAVEAEWERLHDSRWNEFQDYLRRGGGGITGFQREALGRKEGVSLPDSLEARVTLPGRLLRDLVLNHPFVFDVQDPPDIEYPFAPTSGNIDLVRFTPQPPLPNAPVVGVIDSGVQSGHRLLQPACPEGWGMNYVSDQQGDLADRVSPGGHGTRVAGAILYGESIPREGHFQLPAWIYNFRVLGENNRMPGRLYPPRYIREIAGYAPRIRLFNQSINASVACRLKHVTAWAAAMDMATYEQNVLFVQSVGNLKSGSGLAHLPGILEHLAANRPYPDYLMENSSRIASPAECLSALAVGSVAYEPTAPHHFSGADHPSSFSRTGLGIWDSIKPDVVEYGGTWSTMEVCRLGWSCTEIQARNSSVPTCTVQVRPMTVTLSALPSQPRRLLDWRRCSNTPFPTNPACCIEPSSPNRHVGPSTLPTASPVSAITVMGFQMKRGRLRIRPFESR